MRLQENGLLKREERAASIVALLQMMARTPQGSWPACPDFGLRDLFEDRSLRSDSARLAMTRINDTFEQLAISGYIVTEVVRELSATREVDTYSITIEDSVSAESFSTSFDHEI